MWRPAWYEGWSDGQGALGDVEQTSEMGELQGGCGTEGHGAAEAFPLY